MKGFSEIASQLFKNFVDKFDKSEVNYPKYLVEELKRLGFSMLDNLKILKVMRNDPSNVEVFKRISIGNEKIAFAKSFLDT